MTGSRAVPPVHAGRTPGSLAGTPTRRTPACASCHTPRAADLSFLPGKDFAGGFKLVDPAFTAYSGNITPDKGTWLGTWTDEEIMRAFREGKSKEGMSSFIVDFPPMPVVTYNTMSDHDAKAIVAYLRTLKPIHNNTKGSSWNIPQEPMPPAKGLPAPPKSDKVAYGGYIVNSVAGCFECHSTRGADGVADLAHHLGAGGFEIELAPGMVVRTPDITPDQETGIGAWDDADIKTAITEGIANGKHLWPPMPYAFYKNMTPDDLDAIVAYLRTIPPIKNKVDRTDYQLTAFP
jgi:mono/diheme cytochrome c family protein